MGMDHRTPRLVAFDSRSLAVRSVDYYRSIERGPAQRRVNRSLFDAAGRGIKQWDPRLWVLQQDDASAPASLSTIYSLSDAALHTVSVDAGIQIGLPGLAKEGLRGWDGRGTQSEVAYDDSLRPVAVFEQGAGQPRRCVERMKYGCPGQGDRDHNQHGQLIRHDDPAGTVLSESFSLTGQSLAQQRRFTLDAANPDWPELEADREPLLEPGDGFLSTWRLGPQSDALEQIDARGNRQQQTLTLDGRIFGSQLLLRGQSQWQPLVSDIRYNAEGQVEEETAGNGVRTRLTYSPQDGRLMSRSARHGDQVLQDLVYAYDPMGNVLSIEDKALPVRYFANQRIEPISRFIYDTLYQLTQATGWEAGALNQGPESVDRSDPAAVSNYRQTYRYDESGNLLELTHVGAQNHGHQMKVARYSNRCLPYRNGVPPTEEEIDAAFDARGNWLELEPGRSLAWDLRNQLGSVTPIARASGLDDSERYVYAGDGQRVRKLRTLQTSSRTLAAEVRYLPGLELRADSGNGESLQVVTVQGGLDSVRILHWESPPPSGENDHYRYSCSDHLGSISLELDHDARIISREHFYPFGETAYLAGDNEVEVSYKTVRYSGKERDATGLYYYGFRYYAPWLQRWVNPDPAGEVDGLNLYRMVRNNPVTLFDTDGRAPTGQKPPPPPLPAPPMPPSLKPGGLSAGPPPPPPPGGLLPSSGTTSHQPAGEAFKPTVLAIPSIPKNRPSARWESKNYVNIEKLSSTIGELFGTEKTVKITDVSQQELFEKIKGISGNQTMEFDADYLNVNPAAWTSPEGMVYMGVDSPDYSVDGKLDKDKIRSTIIHESLHFSSKNYTGFQAMTDMGVSNTNYDEYVTDYFAYQVFNKMFPGATYKTGYFTKGNDKGDANTFMHWGGNLAKFMIDSGHVTSEELVKRYFHTGELKELPEPLVSKWQAFAKQNTRRLLM